MDTYYLSTGSRLLQAPDSLIHLSLSTLALFTPNGGTAVLAIWKTWRMQGPVRRRAKGFDHDKKEQVVETSETQIITTPGSSSARLSERITKRLEAWSVESRGIQPVAVEDRTDTRFIKLFFLWFSANMSIVTFSTGTHGPTTFGLDLGECCVAIVFINLIFALPPAYLATWGPKLGLRQLCVSRYTFGYYGTIIPSLFSIIHGFGFCIMNSILGAQALGSLAPIGGDIGTMLIATISLFTSFFGLKALNRYENFAWIAVLLVFIFATGVGAKHFVNARITPPATMAHIGNYAAALGGYMLLWSINSADYTVYFPPGVSRFILLQCLGAAAAISAPHVPAWKAGYADDNVGGLLNAMLSDAGKLGKGMILVLSLSVAAVNSPRIYSMSLEFQTLIPQLVTYPRYVFSVFPAVLIALLSVVGQHKSYHNVSNFLGAYVGAILVEHLYFRKRNFANYDIQAWNVPSQLPLGAAALGASVMGFLLAITAMNQFGDTSFITAVGVTAVNYFFFRRFEKRRRGV
ncbi:NCS cytosine-purine permease [Russula aff. rugulosa BPL654]|nr:NCS cytosine-purine permease [Russula aff. rugulosa BPL654]